MNDWDSQQGQPEALCQAEASKLENGEDRGKTMVNATEQPEKVGLHEAFFYEPPGTSGVHFKVSNLLFGCGKEAQTVETVAR